MMGQCETYSSTVSKEVVGDGGQGKEREREREQLIYTIILCYLDERLCELVTSVLVLQVFWGWGV